MDREVERIFVNAAVKKALCSDAGRDRSWLQKLRPLAGYIYHFHFRLHCPTDSADCKSPEPLESGDVCVSELDRWFTDAALNPKALTEPPRPRPHLSLADLPQACRQVVAAP